MWQMLDGNASAPAPAAGSSQNLKQCEVCNIERNLLFLLDHNDGILCQTAASGDLCTKLAQCKDQVCSSYYNDPDVERICGVCTMAATGWFGCFAGHSQARFVSATAGFGFAVLTRGCRCGSRGEVQSAWTKWW